MKFINKVSYNIGADTSLLLYGVTQGADNMNEALAAEKKNLQAHYGVAPSEYSFVDGSGGEETTAINRAVTQMLTDMRSHSAFTEYFASLPIMAVDGSLGFVTDFEKDKTLAPAKGNVHAKPGSFVAETADGPFRTAAAPLIGILMCVPQAQQQRSPGARCCALPGSSCSRKL